MPSGRKVTLPGRGTTWVHETPNSPAGCPAVVLLHGWLATAELNWFTVFDALGRRYRVLALDHRGHGKGIRCRRFRLEDCADDVAALLDALQVPQAIAVGYSMGGPIAQLLWRRHRERVSGLVFCATAGNFRHRAPSPLVDFMLPVLAPGVATGLRLVPEARRRKVLADFLASRIRDPQARSRIVSVVAAHDPGAMVQAARELAAFDSGRWIGRVDVPSAVVVTGRDHAIPVALQEVFARSIPGATVHPIPDGTHFACARMPQEFTRVLLEALSSVVKPITAVATSPSPQPIERLRHPG